MTNSFQDQDFWDRSLITGSCITRYRSLITGSIWRLLSIM